MSIQDVIALALVGVALVFVGAKVRKTLQGRGGCGCGSDGSTCGKAAKVSPAAKPRFLPIVQLKADPVERKADH